MKPHAARILTNPMRVVLRGEGGREETLSMLLTWQPPRGFKFRDGMGIDRIPYPAFDQSWEISELDYMRARAQWYRESSRANESNVSRVGTSML